ncbi:Uncharacterised protein [BD1-7 clade bacterium]|uniref:Uncharacterized protein n=1 Tax=BD1-7 clade bacterium TaxID=2029982 RepID=A0A5S9NVJ7_9GAMM|nr:Uncharacterised protein [BD1-7 clade bacterium]CAA0094667.1 Uncharacterised protein [BD1-7 clade bacterium]
MQQDVVRGAGLGLRRAMMSPSYNLDVSAVDFMEVAPENWINVGGRFGKAFRSIAEQVPVTLHGLSLDLGGIRDIDVDLVTSIRQFMDTFDCPLYSEHLSYCADQGHLYDLMPIPFTDDAVKVCAQRIRQVQDILQRRMAIENVSYYAAPHQQLSEIDFINAVVAEADCDLLLDVNNIVVNAINHRYDPVAFLKALPGDRTTYIHVAGHFNEAEDLRVDTHGADVIDDVWQLLEEAYKTFGVLPTLLERDFNIPEMDGLVLEVERIREIQQKVSEQANDNLASA